MRAAMSTHPTVLPVDRVEHRLLLRREHLQSYLKLGVDRRFRRGLAFAQALLGEVGRNLIAERLVVGGVRRGDAPGGAAEVMHAPLEHGAHIGFEVAVAPIVVLIEQFQKEALHLLAGVLRL